MLTEQNDESNFSLAKVEIITLDTHTKAPRTDNSGGWQN